MVHPTSPIEELSTTHQNQQQHFSFYQSVHECLTAKVDPNIQNTFQNTFHPKSKSNHYRPLHYAAKHGNVTLAKLLVRAGAKVDLVNPFGETPLMIASRGKNDGHVDFVVFMIQNGADVNHVDRGGNTSLQWAVQVSNMWIVNELLIHGAKVGTSKGTASATDTVTDTASASVSALNKVLLQHKLFRMAQKIDSDYKSTHPSDNLYSLIRERLRLGDKPKKPCASSTVVDILQRAILWPNYVDVAYPRKKKSMPQKFHQSLEDYMFHIVFDKH